MSESVQGLVSLYMVSKERIVRLQKTLSFVAFPRVHEFLKVHNATMGDYVAFEIVQVTHREGAIPEIWICSTSREDGKTVISFFQNDEIDEWVNGYMTKGWEICSSKPNKTFNEDGTSVWSMVSRDTEAD